MTIEDDILLPLTYATVQMGMKVLRTGASMDCITKGSWYIVGVIASPTKIRLVGVPGLWNTNRFAYNPANDAKGVLPKTIIYNKKASV